uniref:Uncharacterized protein n=1 Tax=Vitis vinifera TaxID=29760 RepID=A5B6T3_VITVI|nr:hypothetical protein VITISV_022255 [Vitis vinifera]
MTTRGVQDPIAIHFLIDGQHGILEARDIAAAMHFPPIPEDLGSFRHWSQYSEPDMVSTLSGGRVTGRTILRRELPPRMLLIDLVLRTNLFPLQHVVQRRGAILDALCRISEGFYFGPHHLVMAALTYFEEKQISGCFRNHFARENGVCEISQTLKRAAKSFRNNMLSSQGCEVGFHLEVPSFPLAVYVGQLQKEIHPTVQKGCGITSQQKGDFAALCKMLPSARSDWLAMAATSSFQLRIAHRLKHWIFDFLSFEMVYSMHQLDFRKRSKSGCYDCHQEYASWQILFTFSPCNLDLLLANDF